MVLTEFNNKDQIDIPFIDGDGIGPEISSVTRDVVNTAVQCVYQGKRSINFLPFMAGQSAHENYGTWLPDQTVDAIKKYKVALKGPLMTPIGKGERSVNVRLRKTLDLFACIRPVSHFPNVPFPVKHPTLNIVIFRENTEDVYAGIEFQSGSKESKKLQAFLESELGVELPTGRSFAFGLKPMSVEGSQRIVEAAIQYAIEHNRKRVTFVHKGNIMKFTEGLFRDVGYDVAETQFSSNVFTMREFENLVQSDGEEKAWSALRQAEESGKIIVDDVIADAALMHLTLSPEKFDVVVLPNLNGDYFSDASAGVVGGLGVAPGANVNFQTGHGVFEATHGTAPDIAGKDMANPSSLILSACMMLEHIGWTEASKVIQYALSLVFEEGILTADLASKGIVPTSCSDFGKKIVQKINQHYQRFT